MSPPIRRKYRDSVAFATGCRRIKNCKRCNRKIRIPIGMWPCRVEEKMTLKEVDGKTVEEIETKIIAKDGTVTRVPGEFQGYETSEEEPVEQPRRHDLYGFVDHPQLQQGNPMNEFAPHRLPQPEGNMNGWLMEDEEELERNEVDSDLESTASSKPVWKKTTKADPDRASRNCPYCSKNCSNTVSKARSLNNFENPDIAAIIAQQLQTILLQIVTQVTNNVNNANGGNSGNGGNNGCTYKGFMACNPKECDGKEGAIALTRWIKKMENMIDNNGCDENQKVRYAASSFVDKALTWWNTQVQARGREAAIVMSWNDFKALLVEELYPSNEMEKLESEAGILTDEAVSCGTLTKGNDKRKVVEESSKSGGSWNTIEGQKPGHLIKDCRAPISQATPVRAVRMSNNPRVCYECGSPDHFRNNCPKRYQGSGQPSNQLALEGNLLFDSGADFSFISIKFAPLLNMKPSIVNPGHGSFDVIVGMDWLSQHKAVIVCHEKVVEIPVEDGRTLRVYGEQTVGIAKALKIAKEDEQKLGDMSIVRNFEDVTLNLATTYTVCTGLERIMEEYYESPLRRTISDGNVSDVITGGTEGADVNKGPVLARSLKTFRLKEKERSKLTFVQPQYPTSGYTKGHPLNLIYHYMKLKTFGKRNYDSWKGSELKRMRQGISVIR
ncbi:putative reverse transcriptase domain-containing protein [Tanacetum coccineum]